MFILKVLTYKYYILSTLIVVRQSHNVIKLNTLLTNFNSHKSYKHQKKRLYYLLGDLVRHYLKLDKLKRRCLV